MLPSIRLVVLAGILATVASGAHAASYNCARAKQPDEIAICDSRSLSELDVQMATLYGVRMSIPMLMGSKGAAQDEQRQFLSDRATCGGDATCLATAYTERIDALRQTISQAMQDYCQKLGICG
jgi:uncharacterized protein